MLTCLCSCALSVQFIWSLYQSAIKRLLHARSARIVAPAVALKGGPLASLGEEPLYSGCELPSQAAPFSYFCSLLTPPKGGCSSTSLCEIPKILSLTMNTTTTQVALDSSDKVALLPSACTTRLRHMSIRHHIHISIAPNTCAHYIPRLHQILTRHYHKEAAAGVDSPSREWAGGKTKQIADP